MAKPIVRSPSGGFIRRTIGFVSEVVEDREDHDTFGVTGGSHSRPDPCIMRDYEDPSAGRVK